MYFSPHAHAMLGKRKHQSTGIDWVDLPSGCPERVFFEHKPLVQALAPYTHRSFHHIWNKFRRMEQQTSVLNALPVSRKTSHAVRWFLLQFSKTEATEDPTDWAWKFCGLVALIDQCKQLYPGMVFRWGERILSCLGSRLLELCAVSHAQGAFPSLHTHVVAYIKSLMPRMLFGRYGYVQHLLSDCKVRQTMALGSIYRSCMRRRTAFLVLAVEGARSHKQFQVLQRKDAVLLSFLRYFSTGNKQLEATRSLSDFYERPTYHQWRAMERCPGITPSILDGAFCYLYRMAAVRWIHHWKDVARLTKHCQALFLTRQDDPTDDYCRICFNHMSPASELHLVFPCACKAPVHRYCLEKWNATRNCSARHCCEVCTSRYTFPAPRVSAALHVTSQLMEWCEKKM